MGGELRPNEGQSLSPGQDAPETLRVVLVHRMVVVGNVGVQFATPVSC